MATQEDSILITAADKTLGYALVKRFLKSEHSRQTIGLFGVRDPSNAKALEKLLKGSSHKHHRIIKMDLSSPQTVNQAADNLVRMVRTREVEAIRAIILCARVIRLTMNEYREDRDKPLDSTIMTNYLASFMLVWKLKACLDTECGRIIVVTSHLHNHTKWREAGFARPDETEVYRAFQPRNPLAQWLAAAPINPSGQSLPPREIDYLIHGLRQYAASHTFQMLWMKSLQEKLLRVRRYSRIRVMGVDPGVTIPTLPQRSSFPTRALDTVRSQINRLLARDPLAKYYKSSGQSAKFLLGLCYDTVLHLGGAYFEGECPRQIGWEIDFPQKQKRLWKETMGILDLYEKRTFAPNPTRELMARGVFTHAQLPRE